MSMSISTYTCSLYMTYAQLDDGSIIAVEMVELKLKQ